jgi:hypothetical protein
VSCKRIKRDVSVTVHLPVDWEVADLDESPSIATTGWRRPRSVVLDGDDLVFRWPSDLELYAQVHYAPDPRAPYEQWRDKRRFLMSLGEPDIYPSRAILLRFAQLENAAPERIRLFASRYGALQEQVSPDPAWVVPPLLPDRQALSYWRGVTRSFRSALDLAARSVRTVPDEANLMWWVNGHLGASGVTDFLTFVEGRPRILHGSGGLYGGMAVELLAAVAGAVIKLCTGCGGQVEPGGRLFCQACRDDGVPVRLRQRRYRGRLTGAEPSSEAADF